MAALLAPTIVKSLLAIGPTLLRGIGARKGGVAAIAAKAVADVLESKDGVTIAKVSSVVSNLPPEERAEVLSLINEGEKIKAELEGKRLEASTREFEAEQETHRDALKSTDVYTTRTRPLIARQSWYVSAGYALGATILPELLPESKLSFDPLLYLAMATPALTYMGVRTVDKVTNFLSKGRVK